MIYSFSSGVFVAAFFQEEICRISLAALSAVTVHPLPLLLVSLDPATAAFFHALGLLEILAVRIAGIGGEV